MNKELYNNLVRSNRAYKMYLNRRTYYNALKIYNANIVIYDILNRYLTTDQKDIPLDELISYIFHLEDWFLQFEVNAEKINHIGEQFVFESYEDYVPFPDYFKLKDK